MEALMWRASNVAISYGVIRGSSGTQEKEKKQGPAQVHKSTDKARLAEKSVATSGNGRSFTMAPLPFPYARNFVPAPLRFLWFPNTGKNDEQGTGSIVKETGEQTEVGNFLEEGGGKEAIPLEESGGDLVSPQLDVRESGDLGPGIICPPGTQSDKRGSEGLEEVDRSENGNAAKRWLQSLLNTNFLRKRADLILPATEVLENVDESLPFSGGLEPEPSSNVTEGKLETLQQDGASAGIDLTVDEICCACGGCANEIRESYVVDPAASPLSTLEVPHVNVTHDLESFSKFLSEVPLSELNLIARTSFLSKLAYAVPQIKPGELAKYHHMVFVTSSIDIKADALARERAAAAAKGDVDRSESANEAKQDSYLSPATAYALAAAATSFLRSQKKETQQDVPEDERVDSNISNKDAVSSEKATRALDAGCVDKFQGDEQVASEKSKQLGIPSDMPPFMGPVTSVVSAEKETKQEVANNLRSLHTCPCEWFACDDKNGQTRFFSIQGSESFASWQANLLFEPVQFEASDLGVMVHRGIYEAAIGLYEQILPYVLEHQKKYGERARFQFTGHSLGGSLGVLLSLMLKIRGVVETSALLPVYTFGSPYIMCGGDYLLKRLGLPLKHVQSVVMHRDIVPRTFACSYPDHIAEVLKRVNGTFREHTCLIRQRLLYAPMGQLMVLQPDQRQSSPHPLLPSGSGLYLIGHQSHKEPSAVNNADGVPCTAVQVRAAQRAFLNQPHPLETISDPAAYGSEGTISQHHDPRHYCRAINSVLRKEMRRWRQVQRERRRQLWWPLISGESAYPSSLGASLGVQKEQGTFKTVSRQGMSGPSRLSHYVSDLGAGRAAFPSSVSGGLKGRFSRYKTLIASQHVQMTLVVLLTARMLFVEGLALALAWV